MATSILVGRGPALLTAPRTTTTDESGIDGAVIGRAQFDPAAFAPLYDRYFDAIYRYCYRRLGDPEDAADATSAVFVRALAALPRYRHRGVGSFRSWLFSIAHNTVTDGYRSRGRQRETPIEAAGHLAATSRDGCPEAAAIATESRSTLLAALTQLTPDQRRIVELRLAGLTGPEIADVLDRTLGAVKIAQHRAYAKLRVILTEVGREAGAQSGAGGAA